MRTKARLERRGKLASLLFACLLACELVFEIGLPTTQASAALYTTNLSIYLDPSNATSYSNPASGNTWSDLSGLGHDFTRASSGGSIPTFQSGSPNSFLFTRTSNSGSPPSHGGYFSGLNSWLGGNDFTVSAWIKTINVGNSTNHWEVMHILSAESGGGAPDWGFGINDTGKLAFGIGPSDVTYNSPSAVNTGVWTYVAASRTKSTGVVRLYVNGTLVTTSASNGNTGTLTQNSAIRIGAGDDGGVSFGGNIGAVLAYSALLTDSQIADNFNATKGSYGFSTATTTSIGILNASTTFGSIDTLTAIINNAAATGTVNFLNGGTSISGCSVKTVTSGVATCPFVPTSTGTFSNLTAVYSGDSNYATSTSSAVSVTVTQGAPTLSISVATSVPYRIGTSIIAISSPAGTDGKVSFTANGKRIAGCLKLSSTSLTTTCNWLPTVKSYFTIQATLTPASSNFSSVSALPKLVFVSARSTRR